LSNYITTIVFTICICFLIELNILEIDVINFFIKYFSENIELYSESTLRIILIVLLGLFCHFGINFIIMAYMMDAIECYVKVFNRKTKKNNIKV
jgi:hypothetical protein